MWIDSGYSAPPALETRSCLYVLRFSVVGPPITKSVTSSLSPSVTDLNATIDTGDDDDDSDVKEKIHKEKVLTSARLGVEDGAETVPWQVEGQDEERVRREGTQDGREFAGGGEKLPPTERSETGVWFYVGESDRIRERLRQHRMRWGVSPSSPSSRTCFSPSASRYPVAEAGRSRLDTIVLPVDNKSDARRLETSLIRAMKDEGFHLLSDRDGSRAVLPPSPAWSPPHPFPRNENS